MNSRKIKKLNESNIKKIIVDVPCSFKKDFLVKCAKVGETQRGVIIELIYLWLKNKIKIPCEKRGK